MKIKMKVVKHMYGFYTEKLVLMSSVTMYSRRLSRPGSNGCCGFFGLLGHVLKVVFPNISPVSSEDSKLCSGVVWLGRGVFMAVSWDD